ncbi:MAG: bifunctional oligoribonuclease/PAP phosphatase NrnA [Clostridia bacterium]|nr:bifunctional oligoribonuclease/PAP phosphatase NrnA [Clostridia bacterium]
MSLKAARSFIERNDNFLLIAHVSPDGDTLGSCLALYEALLQCKKRVQIACEEPVPPLYSFLKYSERVVNLEGINPFDSVICIDCADIRRTGFLQPLVEGAKHSFCIDHHETNPHYTDEDWIMDCAATGEMIYELIKDMGVALTESMSVALFCALSTDTGNFAYSNTTPQTFEIAARLLECGFDLPEVNRRLFRTVGLKKTQLIGIILTRLCLYKNDSFGISQLHRSDLAALNATDADCEGLIDYIRDIDTVEVACVLRESNSGLIRVSLRSKYDFDVLNVVAKFSGGGHKRAAGCTLDCSMEQAMELIKAEVLNQMGE